MTKIEDLRINQKVKILGTTLYKSGEVGVVEVIGNTNEEKVFVRFQGGFRRWYIPGNLEIVEKVEEK